MRGETQDKKEVATMLIELGLVVVMLIVVFYVSLKFTALADKHRNS